MTGAHLANAARALVGTPFRLHGRDRKNGLDCVGVLAVAFATCGLSARLPARYSLRAHNLPNLTPITTGLGLREAEDPIEAGDVILVHPGACQYHLAIATTLNRFVHAHAGLRRVVEGPLPAHWPVIGHWRFPSQGA